MLLWMRARPDALNAGAAPATRRAAAAAASAPPRSRCAHHPPLRLSTRPARPCVTTPCRVPSVPLPGGGPGAAGLAPAAAPPATRPRHVTAAPPACPDRPSWPLPRLRWCRRRARSSCQGQDLLLAQVHFQLHRAQHLLEFALRRARVRVENARHLHGQGRTAGHDAPPRSSWAAGTQHRHRVDPRWRQNQRSS